MKSIEQNESATPAKQATRATRTRPVRPDLVPGFVRLRAAGALAGVCFRTLYRWYSVGLRGVKLQAVFRGGQLWTKRRWINEFNERVQMARIEGRWEAERETPSQERKRAERFAKKYKEMTSR